MEMHTVVLSTTKPPTNEQSYAGLLWKGLVEVKKLKTRIYQTYIDDSKCDKRFILSTTSKDLHLKLGSFDWRIQYNFAKFLEEEFEKGRCARLLLCFKGESENSEEGLLVTKVTEGGQIIFTLALAR